MKRRISSNRPTSPHLTIYKVQISSTLSILHRFTGMVLFGALSVLIWWFILLNFSESPNCYLQLSQKCVVKICLVIVSFVWSYHLCNGIRHLMWDSGYGFSIKAINRTGWGVIILSTVIAVLLCYMCLFV